MDTLSLIVVSDETSPVRRFSLPKVMLKRAAIGAGLFAVAVVGLSVDYVRLRMDNHELASLRKESVERRAQVAAFEKKMGEVDGRLAKLSELERKVRIIANLPGAAASGGEEVTPVEPEVEPGGQGGVEEPTPAVATAHRHSRLPAIPPGAGVLQRVSLLDQSADYLGSIAAGQSDSLENLLHSLEGKRERLESSPSIWPSKGWLTSTFGYRISPFTNQKQFHAGIDIAGTPGTDVVAPARGRVVFAGENGALGNCLIIDHGYGVRTQYGHNQAFYVKPGQIVERGQRIAALGNSGRSTGPHLHYMVEVNGKTRNPLDYIFD
ncbi:MAG TPA: M23 family metallopeptidase [Myxococcota bacterium]|nr:M23 family metallopeptidase [Myxococcota bacterium]